MSGRKKAKSAVDAAPRAARRRARGRAPDRSRRSRFPLPSSQRAAPPQARRHRPRRSHRLPVHRCRVARLRAHAHFGAQRRAQSRRQLSAARISRRPRARTGRSPTCCIAPSRKPTRANCRAGLPISCARKPAPKSRAPIDLGAAIRVGSSEANAGARKRPAILADVCEAVIGAVYLDGGYKAAAKPGRAAVAAAHARRRCSRCAIRRPSCRNGRRRAACRRRPIARSPAPVPITIPNSASPCSFPALAPAEGWAAPNAPRNRPRQPPCWRARASNRRAAHG